MRKKLASCPECGAAAGKPRRGLWPRLKKLVTGKASCVCQKCGSRFDTGYWRPLGTYRVSPSCDSNEEIQVRSGGVFLHVLRYVTGLRELRCQACGCRFHRILHYPYRQHYYIGMTDSWPATAPAEKSLTPDQAYWFNQQNMLWYLMDQNRQITTGLLHVVDRQDKECGTQHAGPREALRRDRPARGRRRDPGGGRRLGRQSGAALRALLHP